MASDVQGGESVDLGPRCLVVGGAGFLGRALARTLVDRGLEVVALDRRPDPELEGVTYHVADLRDHAAVRRAASGCSTVFHTAAVINLLGVYDRATRQEVYDINYGGTWNVIDACREAGAGRLVYTSTDSVVYSDAPLEDVDESCPYPERFLDIYAETKTAAERAVLAADGRHGLRTVAIRPAGLWGPGPGCYMLERFVEELASGKFVMRVGDGSARADSTYVDSLVHAEILAAGKLVTHPRRVAGRAYFVTDEEPMNVFEFFAPLVEALGYCMPRLRIPAAPLYHAAHAMEWVHRLGGPWPALTRLEVHNMTSSFTFSTARARRDLGYRPLVTHAEGMERCVPHCRTLLEEARR